MPSTDKISKEVINNGFSKVQNWLSQEDQDKITNIILKKKPTKGSSESTACLSFKSVILNVIQFKYEKILSSLFLSDLSKKLQLKEIAEKIFAAKAKLTNIDYYFSDKSFEPVLDWHCDNAYSGKKDVKTYLSPDDFSIKFFFYLTNVYPDNGCLSYISKSNKVTYALRKGIYEEKITYSPYWRLIDLRNKIKEKETLDYIKNFVTKEDIDDFLNQANYVINNNYKTDKYDQTINKGGAIVFDESGIHRGSATKFSTRLALRFFFKKVI